MARNGSGTYSVPNTFLPNTTMSATAVNQNFTDAGSEITNSLARDGQTAMSGALKLTDGSTGAPGLAFANDTNTGFRRASADEIRWVGGGSDRMYIDSVGQAYLLGAVSITGAVSIGGALSGAGVPDLAAIEALSGTGILKRTGSATWALDNATFSLTITKDNLGTVLPTGILGDISIPVDCTLTSWTLLADQSGSIVVDVWKDTLANYPPTVADTITASAKPTITTATNATDSTLTGWTTACTAGDTLRFKIDSVTSITRIAIFITAKRF